ncbi:hypothetical protein LEP1GSC188_3726 [Leptospira weilii serovar Topaz str. LT2116]|uniref:Uncharacterized protein n=1 Tax=Leptospira weilii serovar Topaz str. LT2116 TaxID=1088540 RepID=M3FJJ5_9LEPT|nr:hypothetical protein LEP1GSC188_3726 [Leptospira weilii serovar Topaz str. LT2116]
MQDSKGILYRQEGTNEFPPTFTLLEPNPTGPELECIQIFCSLNLTFKLFPFIKKSNRFNFRELLLKVCPKVLEL